MYQTIFSAPRVTYEMIEQLVSQGAVETAVLEYKRQITGDNSVYRTIAAMANGEGGVILVGVHEDKVTKKPQVTGVAPTTADDVANTCANVLQPRYVPELISVRLSDDSDRIVLLIRINSETAPRPLVVRDQGVYIRSGASTKPADLFALRGLFLERQAGYGPERVAHVNALHPSNFLAPDRHRKVALHIRVGISARHPFEAPILNGAKRDEFLQALGETAPISWVRKGMPEERRKAEWKQVHPNTSRDITVETGGIGPSLVVAHGSVYPPRIVIDLLLFGAENSVRGTIRSVGLTEVLELVRISLEAVLSERLWKLWGPEQPLWSPAFEMHLMSRNGISFEGQKWVNGSPPSEFAASVSLPLELDGAEAPLPYVYNKIRIGLTKTLMDYGCLTAETALGPV